MTDYKELYESAPVGLWQTSIEDGHFLSANETAIQILGFESLEDLSSAVATDFYKDKSARSRLISELSQVGEIKDFRFRMKRKDGSEFTALISAKIHPDKGYIEGTLEDVTDGVSLEACIIPHLEKMSLLRQNIINRLHDDDCCEAETQRKSVKTA